MMEWLILVYSLGVIVIGLIGLGTEWMFDIPVDEVLFRIFIWPVYILLLLIAGGINTWRRFLGSL